MMYEVYVYCCHLFVEPMAWYAVMATRYEC